MSKAIIQVEGLSKRYTIGVAKQHDTLRDQISHGVKRLFRRGGEGKANSHTFWALKDVSFEIQQGEVLGIIGRNGAGKSTLLKILSRITEPTSGRATIHGRVGSLLEVGTGFHPELTGRENIYLNGAILGMKKTEIDRKLDEIIAFSEIEKFVDTPVKRYSSGMYLRLASAVAAHLEPDVLIVDEVLAVGDAGFQKKCLGKMEGVAREGRTVLFVSHNMAAIENLCNKVLFLDGGKVGFAGSTNDTIQFFLNALPGNEANTRSHVIDLKNSPNRQQKFRQKLTRLELHGESGPLTTATLKVGDPLRLFVSFRLEDLSPNLAISLSLENNLGQTLLELTSTFQSDPPTSKGPGDYTVVCDIPSLTLVPNGYKITVHLDVGGVCVDRVVEAARLTVVAADYYGGGILPTRGFVVLPQRWYHQNESQTTSGSGDVSDRSLKGDTKKTVLTL